MKTTKQRAVRAAALAIGAGLVLGATAGRSMAQDFPTREVRLVVPLTAGSSVDTIARSLAAEMGRELKQSVVVENRAGGDSIIATQFVKVAQPDGHTVMLVIPAHAINVHLYPKLPYDPLKDFTPIGLAASNMNMLVVNPQSPFRTTGDLLAAARAKPGTLNFGNAGGTSGGSAELMNFMAKVSTNNIMYKGAPEALNDLIGGRIDFMYTALSSGMAFVKSDKLRAIAVTGPTRHPTLPEVPTVGEAIPDYAVLGWYGLIGPAGIPRAARDRLNQALYKALESADVKQRLATLGFDPAPPAPPEALDAFVKAEIEKWGKVTRPRE